MSRFRDGDTFAGDTLHSGTKGLMLPICLKLISSTRALLSGHEFPPREWVKAQ
jgi:hypothetical protein